MNLRLSTPYSLTISNTNEMRIAFSLHLFLSKVNCKYYHDGCMVTGVRSTMEEHEERFYNTDNNYDDVTDNYKFIKCKSQFDPRCRRGSEYGC